MTPTNLKAWRKAMGGLSQQRAADLLGVRRATVTDWENAKQTPPAYLGLACAALAAGLSPWRATPPSESDD